MAEDKGSTTLNLLPHGDRELWVLKSSEWALPVWVNYYTHDQSKREYVAIYPSFVPYESQSIAMNAVVRSHDISGNTTSWVVSARAAEALTAQGLLVKAPGVTPRFYYQWPSNPSLAMMPAEVGRTVKIDAANVPKGYETDEFISHVATHHGIPTSMIRVVLAAIGAEAAEYMITHRYVLNLGFCRLVAVPFRSNWKEIIFAKLKKLNFLSAIRLPSSERWERFKEMGLPAALCSPHNIGAINKPGYAARACYTIEAIPTKEFDETAHAIEYKRISCGTAVYVSEFENAVERLYPHLVDALSAYGRKKALPFARVQEGGRSGVIRFVPTSKLVDTTVHGLHLRHLPVDIVENDKTFSVTAEQRELSRVRPKDPQVQSLPTVPRGTEDVREPAQLGDVVDGGQARADGLPLLDADQGEDAGEPVLPSPEIAGQPPGMDGQRDS
jgi:hypothetical protein